MNPWVTLIQNSFTSRPDIQVHGGTGDRDVVMKLEDASKLAEENHRNYPGIDTVLFFDEANTTESIGLIKEIMCDRTMGGKPLPSLHDHGLRLVAAVNPYRK